MLKLNNKLLAIFLSVLLVSLTGCVDKKKELKNDDGDTVISFKGSRYIRVNIEGVDCIVGAGNYKNTTAITCDWKSKKAN
tara:strand:- start:2747 stop:2986 length:240 start_codon:yes stop_codon:yes gene_type:complete